jgi:UDP-N-acetylglucosamine--N-acetylmuramyl-(pentapeptide) pyrophosphoryl-undecaprenol N-acetylglucosamine transferase
MKYAVLVAGGTGGHINAALAIGEALIEKDFDVLYLTGNRPLDYKLFQGQKVINLDSKPLRTKNPLTFLMNVVKNIVSFLKIFFIYLNRRPKFIVGAGGYVCGPALLAGFLQFIPVFIIEQNAVMGLTNKILGWISTRIFVHFSRTKGLSNNLVRKVRVVGNPTRKSIHAVAPKEYDGQLKVLVFGGSLGATQINNVIFDLLKESPIEKLAIHHQLGSGQKAPEIQTAVEYTPMEYIDDIQVQYEWCDVIISRAGASTVSELAIIKKPVLVFPYPQATDNHQFYNAQIFKEESDFTVEVLDPKLSHSESLQRAKEFLKKASNHELTYSNRPHPGNRSCAEIIREIQRHVGMA